MNPIHENDDMFHGSTEHYDSVGRQMADFVQHAQSIIGASSPLILELPCGYGRVTRKLVERYSKEQIHVAEIMAPALDFVFQEFGVAGYQVVEPVNEFRNIPDSKYDIAVMGSLITHLSEENSRVIFSNFFKKLKSGGIGVITTTGVQARHLLGNSAHYQSEVCQVGSDGQKLLTSSYDNDRFGYAEYISSHTFESRTVDLVGKVYGYSLVPRKWVDDECQKNNLEIAEWLPGGWDGHQDVFFIRKNN